MSHNLKLILVNVFHRHGERSPLDLYDKPLGRITACSKNNEFYERLPIPKKSFFGSFFPRNDSPLSFQLIYKSLNNNECAPGQLTDFGKRNLFNLGRRLKKDYIDTGFISSVYNKEEVHLTSTDFQRTIESLQSLCKGFFQRSEEPISINVGKKGVQSLYTSKFCDYFVKMREEHRKKIHIKYKEDIITIKNYVSKKYNFFKQNMGFYKIFDVVMSSIGNQNNVFKDFSPKILNMCENISLAAFFGFLEDKKNLSIYRGEIVRDLHDRIREAIANPFIKTKMFILSGHDTTIYPLLMVFGIHNKRWPNFGANIVIETYKDNNGENYVRVKHDGKIVELPDCRKFYNGDRTLCDVNEFLRICKEVIPINKKQLCRI